MCKILPLVSILAKTWNAHKYLAGVDLTGDSRPDQREAQAREDNRSGLKAFDPHQIGRILRSPLFHSYTHMIAHIEKIPELLASESEACICHKPLLEGMSQYKRFLTLRRHFGDHMSTCPMAGKVMPEFVAGALDEAFESVWSLTEMSLHLAETWGRNELSPEDREVHMFLTIFEWPLVWHGSGNRHSN